MFGSLIFKSVQAYILNRIFVDVQILADELNYCSGMSRNAMETIVGYYLKFRQEKCIDSDIMSSKLVCMKFLWPMGRWIKQMSLRIRPNRRKDITRTTCLKFKFARNV